MAAGLRPPPQTCVAQSCSRAIKPSILAQFDGAVERRGRGWVLRFERHRAAAILRCASTTSVSGTWLEEGDEMLAEAAGGPSTTMTRWPPVEIRMLARISVERSALLARRFNESNSGHFGSLAFRNALSDTAKLVRIV